MVFGDSSRALCTQVLCFCFRGSWTRPQFMSASRETCLPLQRSGWLPGAEGMLSLASSIMTALTMQQRIHGWARDAEGAGRQEGREAGRQGSEGQGRAG